MIRHTFPIYILDIRNETVVVFPEYFEDIPHSEFWENTVAALFAKELKLPLSEIKNLTYCQRRARIDPERKRVHYGEKQTPQLLDKISQAVKINDLKWVHDHHETRLAYDVFTLKGLLT